VPAAAGSRARRPLGVIVAVLDTNVLVSGFPARGTVPATLLDAWRQGVYQLVISDYILAEFAETWRDA
jgi:predicted nucleic acid-binding protein